MKLNHNISGPVESHGDNGVKEAANLSLLDGMRPEFEDELTVGVHGLSKRKPKDAGAPALGHELREHNSVIVVGIEVGRRIIEGEPAVQKLYC
ncbi:hypothetical protein PanWU01x14_087020 [Parasponia andersonii]|uniref:Uncharacterized protein n=1 Tax=Parasponia andersonii TaxID=3476 RepID=A0A2P5D8E5_PARAD|nr:hypothetical protein PanWU01x14_087020 [Parasponia andersonii]